MRKIKFRAWSSFGSYMHTVGMIKFVQENVIHVYDDNFEYIGEISKITNEVELLQYTGLKDKNVKEIYEGDILKVFHFQESNKKKHYMIKEVAWKEDVAQFYFKCNDEFQNQLYVLLRYSECEVIGNIYENPELLEA